MSPSTTTGDHSRASDACPVLGVRQSTPNAVVLTELGELPLWPRWLKRAARLRNRLLAQHPGSLLQRALEASIMLALEAPAEQLARQPWAGQLAVAMGAIGMPLDLRQPVAIGRQSLQRCGLEHHQQQLDEAATREGASKPLRGERAGELPRGGVLWRGH